MTLQNVLPWILPAQHEVPKPDGKPYAEAAIALPPPDEALQAVRDVLSKDKGLMDPRKYLAEGRSAQAEIVRERIRFLGASHKAG